MSSLKRDSSPNVPFLRQRSKDFKFPKKRSIIKANSVRTSRSMCIMGTNLIFCSCFVFHLPVFGQRIWSVFGNQLRFFGKIQEGTITVELVSVVDIIYLSKRAIFAILKTFSFSLFPTVLKCLT